ncbi:MAG: FAD-dependent oxidoreductase [Pirellulaceae bacterium]
MLTAAQLRDLEPDLTMNVVGGVLHRQDCHLNPNELMRLLRQRVVELGGELRHRSTVKEFRSRGGRILAAVTDTDVIEADQFVIAGGVWSSPLARSLRLKIPMQAGKGYSLTLEHPRELPRYCSILTEARVAVTPIGSRLRFGGTMALTGRDESILPPRIRGILNSIPRYFPRFSTEDFAGIQPWVGLRPVAPDGLPYLGRSRDWRNLVIATGHAMMGVSLAPITGRIVGQLLAGEPTDIDLKLLRPERFG